MIAANLGLFVTTLFWGGFIPVLHLVFDRWDPFSLSVIRYLGALPLFYIALRITERGRLIPPGISIRRLLQVGGLGMGSFGTLYTLGVAHSNPFTAAVLSACGPVVAAIVARLGYGIKPAPGTGLSIALAVAGASLATIDWTNPGNPFHLQGGEILLVLSSVAWSWYSMAAQIHFAGLSQVRLTFLTMAPALVVIFLTYLAMSALGFAHLPPPEPTPRDLVCFAYMSLAVAGMGVLFWNYGVKRLGVVVASMFLNLIPITSMLISLAFGFQPRWEEIAGGALVILGVLQVQLRARHRARI